MDFGIWSVSKCCLQSGSKEGLKSILPGSWIESSDIFFFSTSSWAFGQPHVPQAELFLAVLFAFPLLCCSPPSLLVLSCTLTLAAPRASLSSHYAMQGMPKEDTEPPPPIKHQSSVFCDLREK